MCALVEGSLGASLVLLNAGGPRPRTHRKILEWRVLSQLVGDGMVGSSGTGFRRLLMVEALLIRMINRPVSRSDYCEGRERDSTLEDPCL